MRLHNLAVLLVCLILLSGCALGRADDAAAAKKQMIGLSRENVLACMGPPKRKASDGAIAKLCMRIKGIIDRIKEQVQNVE